MKNLPDSTWKFVDRKQTLIAKGKNNEPKIKDFELKTINGEDLSENILQQEGTYFILFIKSFDDLKPNNEWVKQVSALASKQKLVIVTSVPDAAKAFFAFDSVLKEIAILICDVTAIKTAARAIPTIYKMNGPVVVDKWSAASFNKID